MNTFVWKIWNRISYLHFYVIYLIISHFYTFVRVFMFYILQNHSGVICKLKRWRGSLEDAWKNIGAAFYSYRKIVAQDMLKIWIN